MLGTLINSTNVVDDGWGPPLVDEDWHANCQPTKNLYYKFVEMNKEVNVQ